MMNARARGKKRSIVGEEERSSPSLGESSAGGARESPRPRAPPGKKAKPGITSQSIDDVSPVQVTPVVEEKVNDEVIDEFDDDNLRVENIPTNMDIEDEVNNSEFSAKKVPAYNNQQSAKDQGLKREVKQQIREESSPQDDSYYEILASNEYLDIDPASVKSSLTFWCKCSMPPKGQSGCLTDQCENRAKRVECDLPLCKAGDQCSNRSIQNNAPSKLAITEGFGESIVVATQDVVGGVFMGQYTGQVLSKHKFEEKINSEYRKQQKLYSLPLNEELVVDASTKGSITRLACHSCSPNTEVVAWKVQGLDCLAMYSIKNIKTNESVTFNHTPQYQLLRTSKRCNCGARNCQKILGGFAYGLGPVQCGVCSSKVLEDKVTGVVRLHPDLATPVCGDCLDQYRQVDWSWKLMTSKTPGKEGACRWCTKTGKMVNCSDCPKSFCKKCLKTNLGPNYIKLAETGSWTCLVCDSRPLDKVRAMLWVDGEEAKKFVPNTAPHGSNISLNQSGGKGPSSPAIRAGQAAPLRGSPGNLLRHPGAIRQQRPSTPTSRGMMGPRFPGPRGSPRIGTPTGMNRPSSGKRAGTPFPLRQPSPSPRLLGQSNVTIEKVARPDPPPPPPVQQSRNGQAEAIINQLQRYSGLSIQPISQSVSHLDGILKEVETAYKVLHETVTEARRLAKEEGIMRSKEKIGEGVRAAKVKLGNVESKL